MLMSPSRPLLSMTLLLNYLIWLLTNAFLLSVRSCIIDGKAFTRPQYLQWLVALPCSHLQAYPEFSVVRQTSNPY